MSESSVGQSVHQPILLGPIVSGLVEAFRRLPASAPPHWIIDCTLGGGGHTRGFLAALARDPELARHRVLSLDQDIAPIERARRELAPEIASGRLEVAHTRFSDLAEVAGDRPVLGVLADLGFSSDQIEAGERGLSFQQEGPLDMRLDPSRGVSAWEYLAQVSERELEEVLREYGEERFSRRIAQSIVRARSEGRAPRTTSELVQLIVRGVPSEARKGRLHVATRTFQALRIQVNDELGELDRLLERGILLLKPTGRFAILSFHSLEDRRVKHAFRAPGLQPITKKPIEADEAELAVNPRARSAKLRIVEKLPPGQVSGHRNKYKRTDSTE